MILDSSTQLMAAYAPTDHSTGGGVNWNNTYIDLLAKVDEGMGADIVWFVSINTTAVGATATILFKLETNPTDPTFAAGNLLLAMVPNTGTGLAVASAVAGVQYKVKIPRGSIGRYVRVTVTIGTADLSAGKFDSWLTNDDMQDNIAYAAGYTVT